VNGAEPVHSASKPRGGNGEGSDQGQYEAAGGGRRWYVVDDRSKILGSPKPMSDHP
jgi:hypothetical protein